MNAPSRMGAHKPARITTRIALAIMPLFQPSVPPIVPQTLPNSKRGLRYQLPPLASPALSDVLGKSCNTCSAMPRDGSPNQPVRFQTPSLPYLGSALHIKLCKRPALFWVEAPDCQRGRKWALYPWLEPRKARPPEPGRGCNNFGPPESRPQFTGLNAFHLVKLYKTLHKNLVTLFGRIAFICVAPDCEQLAIRFG